MATQVNVQPGHGKVVVIRPGNSWTRFPGTTIPACSGACFRTSPLAVDDGPLKELADAMKDANPGDAAGNNTKIPAGFTYLGQFVDHDITLDLTSIGDKAGRPEGGRKLPHAGAGSRHRSMGLARTAAGTSMRAIRRCRAARRPGRNC